jgi:glycosyltransferase involved in cell wall biosynthesis
MEPQIRKWVREEGIEDMTEIMINPDNIPTILGDADIYISTSLFEGMSNAIMEAMNADLPIVCTNVGDNNKLVIEGLNGYICPVGDWKELADRTRYLILHDEDRVAFGRKSKEILERNYDVEIFRAKYIKLLQDKISDSGKYE